MKTNKLGTRSSKRKVFLPKWQRWFLTPIFIGLWAFLTYTEFFNEVSTDKLGIVGYIFMSFLFLGMTVMFFLMSSGKLPAYIIEEEIEETEE